MHFYINVGYICPILKYMWCCESVTNMQKQKTAWKIQNQPGGQILFHSTVHCSLCAESNQLWSCCHCCVILLPINLSFLFWKHEELWSNFCHSATGLQCFFQSWLCIEDRCGYFDITQWVVKFCFEAFSWAFFCHHLSFEIGLNK